MSGQDLIALPDDDDQLADAIVEAQLPSLLATLAHLTGDRGMLPDGLRPDPDMLREADTGYTPDQVAQARALALEGLRRFRDDQGTVPNRPSPADVRHILEWATGLEVADRHVPLVLQELALDGDEQRAPQWRLDDIAPDRALDVVIIGAGMSGIAAAHRLDQAGVPFVVFEKNDTPGGTWYENSYPGCRVDVQNHSYSYSFAQRTDWPKYFSPRNVLASYFADCAERLGITDRIEFRTDVTSASWSDDDQRWTLTVASPAGERTVQAAVVISAVGQLNRPKMPDIAGIDAFDGPSWHTARWNHDVDLDGKRVVIIGTGATACQVIPTIAGDVEHLTVFQRTPPWNLPAPTYDHDVPAGFNWLLSRVPFYAQWYRIWLLWRSAIGMMPYAVVDPEYPPTERSVSAENDEMRAQLTEMYRMMTAGDDELFAKVVPDYPPFAKRFVVDDGALLRAYRRDNVDLVTTAIDRIEPEGVRDVDGTLHHADVIVYGTGFQASDFLTPMTVTGSGGVDLHERWGGDARAYLGITTPDFPNLFFLYGPNTNIVVNGSIIFYSECEVDYVLEALRTLAAGDKASMSVRRGVHDRYNEEIDEANLLRTWGFSDVSAWYKNHTGRTAQNWPYTGLEYWERTRVVDADDYEFVPLPGG